MSSFLSVLSSVLPFLLPVLFCVFSLLLFSFVALSLDTVWVGVGVELKIFN